jgi:alpha-beta hydrolase superfamily lysophospholipase
MYTATSRDGTTIAFDRSGDGPPIVLVCGQSTDRSSNAPLAALLAEHFAVFNYDRRGRGDSGDTLPYAVEREVEDLGAVIGEAGGSASVFGVSSGAALALERRRAASPSTSWRSGSRPSTPRRAADRRETWRNGTKG